jgi:phospho-N-acetylmuramoyl-pentapeptide-transferase
VIRQEGPQTHRAKAGTPTMGGLLIMSASLRPTLLWADLRTPTSGFGDRDRGFGAIGFADDYLKIVRRSHHGLLPRYKMGWQIVVRLASASRC